MEDLKESLRQHYAGDKDAIENCLAHITVKDFVEQLELMVIAAAQEERARLLN